jgi:hypothetical protein
MQWILLRPRSCGSLVVPFNSMQWILGLARAPTRSPPQKPHEGFQLHAMDSSPLCQQSWSARLAFNSMQWIRLGGGLAWAEMGFTLSTPCNGFIRGRVAKHTPGSCTFQLHAMDSRRPRGLCGLCWRGPFQLHAMDSPERYNLVNSVNSNISFNSMQWIPPFISSGFPDVLLGSFNSMQWIRPGRRLVRRLQRRDSLSTPCNGFGF